MKLLTVYLFLGFISVSAAAPDWFSDYVKSTPSCERDLLCTVGFGETLAEALGEARSEAAKFFQAKIQSKLEISSNSEQKSSIGSNGTFDESTSKIIKVETNEIINGLEIKRQDQVAGHFYVLMALDRAKTAENLKEKIQGLDTENAQMLELNSRFNYPKILKKLALIEFYNDRYRLLSKAPLILKVKKETVQSKINNLPPLNLAFVTKGKKNPIKLNHTLAELLSPIKINIVSRKKSPDFILKSELIIEEQYFNVPGFKKLNIVYKLELIDSKNVVIGKMSTISEQVARNNDQAIEKAIPEIKEALQDNLDQLSKN